MFPQISSGTGKRVPLLCKSEERFCVSIIYKRSVTAYEKMNLSMRGYHKILKTARTIADLDNEERIQEKHVAEAVFYRNLDNKYRK